MRLDLDRNAPTTAGQSGPMSPSSRPKEQPVESCRLLPTRASTPSTGARGRLNGLEPQWQWGLRANAVRVEAAVGRLGRWWRLFGRRCPLVRLGRIHTVRHPGPFTSLGLVDHNARRRPGRNQGTRRSGQPTGQMLPVGDVSIVGRPKGRRSSPYIGGWPRPMCIATCGTKDRRNSRRSDSLVRR